MWPVRRRRLVTLETETPTQTLVPLLVEHPLPSSQYRGSLRLKDILHKKCFLQSYASKQNFVQTYASSRGRRGVRRHRYRVNFTRKPMLAASQNVCGITLLWQSCGSNFANLCLK